MDELKLRQLISRWLDGAIEPDELCALQDALKESASARRIYLVCMSVHAELCNTATAKEHLQSLIGAGAESARKDDKAVWNQPTASFVRSLLVIAAGLMLIIGLWQTSGRWRTEIANRESSILNLIEPTSDDCHWYVEHSRHAEAKSCRPGDVIRVTSGKLNLTYLNGTEVVLHSPAAYQLISAMNARMLSGRLTATVSEAGKGFSVITPRATVIDLGTEFGVEVDDVGATDVVVFKGEVDVDYHDDDVDQVSRQRLRMGEAVRLDSTGTASRIVSINDSTYASAPSKAASRPLVISKVGDNIERTSVLNYYEIVHAGMGEDALAFVDRESHQYNGLTAAGMPAYLIGGDYVKMFNNDKAIPNILVNVELAAPAKLYVLIDDRVTLPEWLRESFQDTGDNIGMDTGPFFSNSQWHNKGPAGVGPGESVEDTLSIWVRHVPAVGVITLGATEDPAEGSNMYGIVAVPLAPPQSTQ